MAVKLILTDIDGTILPRGRRQVSERTVAAFHAAIDAGLWVGAASGRGYSWIPDFFGGDAACCSTALATNGMQVYLVPDIIAPTPEIEAMTHEVLSTLANLPAAIARA